MLPHAAYLNILTKTPDGVQREMDAIRDDYKDYALKDPDTFLKSYNNPKVVLISKLKKLMANSEIKFEKGTAFWAKTNTPITVLDPSKDVFDFLSDFALTEEGKTFNNNIQGVFNNLGK